MSDTYCGKSCQDCSYRDALNCPGCELGPGREMSNECELAYCCRNKGHKTCATCEIKARCGKYINKGKAPKERIENNKADSDRKESLSVMAEFLSDKIKILFFVLIISNVFSVIAKYILPEDSTLSAIILRILSVVYGIVLIIISKADKKFLISGLLIFVSNIINIIAVLVMDISIGTSIFALIIISVIALVAEYNEIMGHSDVLMAYERDMCEKWIKIWYGYIIALIISVLGVLLGSGVILLLSAVVELVLAVLKIIYLYQTAEIYRMYYWNN